MLEVKDLRIHFHNALPERNAVDGVSFSVPEGGIIGLVGESGSGKTVTAMAVSGLLTRHQAVCSGEVLLDGKNLLTLPRSEIRKLQGSTMSVVFQEPMTSFDPCMKIGPQIEESLILHTKLGAKERKEKALSAMADAELQDPASVYEKYPHELSGGMLQRAMIAAAIVSSPSIIFCDEPTTALDVTIQEQILKLLKKINRERNTSILFISHNLQVVRKLCTSVLVMQRGKIVERGDTETVFRSPQHEYTRQLIAAIPTMDRKLGFSVRGEEKEKGAESAQESVVS